MSMIANNENNIMTPSDDNIIITSKPKPMMMIDFDGVINAFPDRKIMRRGGIGKTSWLKDNDPRKQLYSIENAFILNGNETIRIDYDKYHIHYAKELVSIIASIIKSKQADYTWLTTWQPYTSILNSKLGIDFHTETAQWYNHEMPLTSQKGKIDWLKSYLRNDYQYMLKSHPGVKNANSNEFNRMLTPIIWIDDEMVRNWSISEIMQTTPAPILFIRPNYRTGINRKQMNAIIEWIHDDSRTTEQLLEPLDYDADNASFIE